MATTNLENQLQSAQKNLLFLQREHAGTLKGLHAEIRRLQQHCTDLTYELTLKGSDSAGAGSWRSGGLRRRLEELEEQLRAKEQEKEALAAALAQRNAAIAVLETTARERERKYLDELKAKSRQLGLLTAELEQRAGTVAYLTAQLHAARRQLLGAGGSSDSSPARSPALAGYKPAPPKDKLPDTPRRRMKKSLSAPLHAELDDAHRAGPEGRRLLLREPVEAMPDPTPFLLAREAAEVQLIKERPLVIPPIASDRGAGETHKAHVGVAHRIQQPPPGTETLAVDPVSAAKVARKPPGADRTV